MRSFLTAAALVASSIGARAYHDNGERLRKGPLTDNLDYLKQGLEDHLGWPGFHWDEWVGDWIPQTCKTIAEARYFDTPYFSPYDFEVYNVHYDDCSEPWVFCHHKDSPISLETMARLFGRVPIQMRQYVRNVIDVPGDNGHAFEIDQAITFVRPVDDMIATVIHETGHALDFGGAYSQVPLSSSDYWWDNYNQDPGVPDNYAQTNAIEDVAQNTVISVFNENVPGGLGSVQPYWQFIFHQYATMTGEGRDRGDGNSIFTPGMSGSCTHRVANSPTAAKGNNNRARSVKPNVSFRSNITLIDVSHRNESHPKCTLKFD